VVGSSGVSSEASNGLGGMESGVLSSAAASEKKLLLSKTAASADRTRGFVICMSFFLFFVLL
jgi:hypothetical protein